MRLRATITEGDKETSTLVPLATVLEFTDAHEGRKLNDCIENGDYTDWEPWVGWHAASRRLGETRDFDDWCRAVDWVQIDNFEAPDPSGGEPNQTGTGSPASSSKRGARGRSS